MKKRICSLLLGLTMTMSVPFSVFAAQPVDEVAVTTTQGGDYNQMEQTILEGIGRDGSVVWTYDTQMKERGEKGNIYWSGQSGNLFFLNHKGSLMAFDIQSGQILWNTPEGEYSYAHGIFDGSGNLCMVSTKGPITLLDRSGVVLARFNTDRKYSSLIVTKMTMKDNHLTLKYAAEGFGADTKAFNDYQTMPSLTVNLTRYQSQVKVTIDQTPVTFDVPPFIEQNRTFVPVRAIFEALGAEVGWDGATKTVTAKKDGMDISLVIGKKEIVVNGNAKALDVAPQIVHDRTLVPARAVSEAFGYQVGWDGATKTVSVSTEKKEPEPLILETTPISYIGQTYGALTQSFGDVSQVNWYNGPIVALSRSTAWMGFGNGEWYQSNTEYQLTDDLICTSIITSASRLFPKMGTSISLDELVRAFGIQTPVPQTDAEGNLAVAFEYSGRQVTVYMTDQTTISEDNLIFIQ